MQFVSQRFAEDSFTAARIEFFIPLRPLLQWRGAEGWNAEFPRVRVRRSLDLGPFVKGPKAKPGACGTHHGNESGDEGKKVI